MWQHAHPSAVVTLKLRSPALGSQCQCWSQQWWSSGACRRPAAGRRRPAGWRPAGGCTRAQPSGGQRQLPGTCLGTRTCAPERWLVRGPCLHSSRGWGASQKRPCGAGSSGPRARGAQGRAHHGLCLTRAMRACSGAYMLQQRLQSVQLRPGEMALSMPSDNMPYMTQSRRPFHASCT